MHKHNSTPDTEQVDSPRPNETLAVLPLIPPFILLAACFEWLVFVLIPTLFNQHTAAYRPFLENISFTAIGFVLNWSAFMALKAKHWLHMWLFLLGSFLLMLSF